MRVPCLIVYYYAKVRQSLLPKLIHLTMMQPPKILIVDDDKDLQRVLQLELETFSYNVCFAPNGLDALAKSRSENPDLIILDVNIPGLDGLEVCRKIRSESTVPILMLSALREDYDRIVGLEVGADDYLGKPCNPRELLARVRALLRRSRMTKGNDPNPDHELRIGGLLLNTESHQAWQKEEPLSLTPIEFALLEQLMANHQKVLSREELIESIWGNDFVSSPRILDTHIRNLRRKLEPAGPCIEVVRGIGFKIS